ncbi:MAG: SCP2 sterol-binding domain-containing protein [Verrucomicrobia bacterium]|nr:SCP2 sterol-binding domain-containing protein [Verrucomicrobiota bacterium]
MRRSLVFLVLCSVALSTAHAVAKERKKHTPQEVFNAMREAFQPEKARGVHAGYQFNISGPHGGEWWIEVHDGKFKMGHGRIENPSVTLAASDKDWVALSNDQLSGIWATLTGRLKVRGDQSLARKLDEMFP